MYPITPGQIYLSAAAYRAVDNDERLTPQEKATMIEQIRRSKLPNYPRGLTAEKRIEQAMPQILERRNADHVFFEAYKKAATEATDEHDFANRFLMEARKTGKREHQYICW
jgi:hypothetical protein